MDLEPIDDSPLPPLGNVDALDSTSRLTIFILLVFAAGFSAMLWPEWRHDPDLSHGLLMPLVFFVLIRASRRQGPFRWFYSPALLGFCLCIVLLASLTALALAGLYAAALGWTHALVEWLLGVSLAGFLGAGVIAFADVRVLLVPLNWSSFLAAGLWILSAPIPRGTYSRITAALQLGVTESVLRTLHVVGVAAHRSGNIIELARGSVGVEEACSGVRSLISCLFVALLLSGTVLRRVRHRVLLVALAGPLALGMNFIRSLVLTLLANAGKDISNGWHDGTGFAVLGTTAVVLIGIALVLERGEPTRELPSLSATAWQLRARGPQLMLSVASIVGLVSLGFFFANTRSEPERNGRVPDLLKLLPEHAAGWQIRTNTDIYKFSGILQTTNLAQRAYLKPAPGGPVDVTIYIAYWKPGAAPVSLVASHTPDACWPGAGWASIPAAAGDVAGISGRSLPPAESRAYQLGPTVEHVWFWHFFDGRLIAYHDPYSPTALLRLAVTYGFRHDGSQLFVRISSNAPWSTVASEPFIRDFFSRVRPLGL